MSNKRNDLYYLFPGQGQGKTKRLLIHLTVAFIVGLITAGVLVAVFYFMQA